jgi:hypothetical protein
VQFTSKSLSTQPFIEEKLCKTIEILKSAAPKQEDCFGHLLKRHTTEDLILFTSTEPEDLGARLDICNLKQNFKK